MKGLKNKIGSKLLFLAVDPMSLSMKMFAIVGAALVPIAMPMNRMNNCESNVKSLNESIWTRRLIKNSLVRSSVECFSHMLNSFIMWYVRVKTNHIN